MTIFDSINHAMTTIATGGFSTKNASFGHYTGSGIPMVATVFMLLSALPFVLFLKAARGNVKSLFKDTQVQFFLTIVAVIITITTLYLTSIFPGNSLIINIELAAFNVASLITGTGFVSTDYTLWGSFFIGFSFFFMVIGGCAGSTSCGIKIFRIQILYQLAKAQLNKLLYPNGVFVPFYNNKPIETQVLSSVLSFFFFFALSFSAVAIILCFTGLDFITALSAAATSIANVGPGLGDVIGPSGNFSSLTDLSKYVLCVSMLLGRLELFTVLVLFLPRFWKN